MSEALGGIAALLDGQEIGLERRISEAMATVPSDAALAETYVDPADRLRVRRRAAIAAVLDAVFDHSFAPHLAGPTRTIEVGGDDNAALLNAARLDFQHDRARLDNGRSAELVLQPVGRETVDAVRGIKPSRELMILGLVLIELWQKSDAPQYTTQRQVLNLVADSTGMTFATIKTQRSNFENGQNCSPPELAYYAQHLDLMREMAAGSGHSSFALLLPAFLARSELAYPRTKSAASEG